MTSWHRISGECLELLDSCRIFATKYQNDGRKPYPLMEEDELIQDGVLQITPELEGIIEEVERGKVVSMDEFKTMFARWIEEDLLLKISHQEVMAGKSYSQEESEHYLNQRFSLIDKS